MHALMSNASLDSASCQPVLADILHVLTSNFSLQNQLPPPSYSLYDRWDPYAIGNNRHGPTLNSAEMISLVRFIPDSKRQDLLPVLLEKIKTTRKGFSGNELERTMLPFLREILQLGKEREMDWTAPPIQMLFIETLQHYISDTMRSEPPLPQQIMPRQLGCGCVRCQKLDTFLANDALKEESFREYVKVRRHLEERLQRVQTRKLLHWSSRREGKGPEVLRVSKSDGHHEYRRVGTPTRQG